MKSEELKSAYEIACQAKGFSPTDGQLKVWWKVLGKLERRDLDAAILQWFSTHTEFPMPAQLGATANDLRRQRTAKATEHHQQQQCPKCNGVVAMMRPIGEQFRTWCLACQSYRKIVPQDLTLAESEWQMLVVELDNIYRGWVARGSFYDDCIDPQFDRERIRGGFSQGALPIPAGLR